MSATLELTPAAAWRHLLKVRPVSYARTRNHLHGDSTGLSPFLTHGLLSLPQVLQLLRQRHGLVRDHKLIFELGWRAYFRHQWRYAGEAIFGSLHAGPLPDGLYATQLPADVREGRTGLGVVDEAVRQLYSHGLLHNHARMWLASYLVHLRKVHWRVGADWLYGHLLDGDLASNHLSWQWVAGTASRKPYVFNAANVQRYAPPAWWAQSTQLDVGYDVLDQWARDADFRLHPELPAREDDASLPWPVAAPALRTSDMPVLTPIGLAEPERLQGPPEGFFSAPDVQVLRDRDVWLVHPWSLADPPARGAESRVVVAVCDSGFHRRWPWSSARWAPVQRRMAELTPHRWQGDSATLRKALSSAARVQGCWDPHLGPEWLDLGLHDPGTGFSDPGRRCRSFSDWWSRTSLQLQAGDGATGGPPAL